MKSKEELNALKEEVEALNVKLSTLSEEELEQVTGGFVRTPEPEETEESVGEDLPTRDAFCVF